MRMTESYFVRTANEERHGGNSIKRPHLWAAMGNDGDARTQTYADYLNLHEFLDLQGGDELSNDQLHFVIVHQSFELWFKLIISELRCVRDVLDQTLVPEAEVPTAVHHMERVTEIFRLMAHQWKVMGTLTPQDFLTFRDGLGTASGFESFQMRELEIMLGLPDSDRVAEMDPLAHFRKLAERSERDAEILANLEATAAAPSLAESLTRWLTRTPIQGSLYGDEGDDAVVAGFVEEYLLAQARLSDEAVQRLATQGVQDMDAVRARFEGAAAGAREFLMPDGEADRARVGLLFIESYRELPLLAWPRTLIDAVVGLEEAMLLWRSAHARMVERMIGRRVGTGGSSGVDYLDATTRYRVFGDLWAVRTLLIKQEALPPLVNPHFYGFAGDSA
ncbi:MAG: tryptophan 2,3-dioxygenase [Methanobacteriota archaeon]|nr:MAG: tryptophan 2,3-dioxygenase [Euryarchaeota archaeon]